MPRLPTNTMRRSEDVRYGPPELLAERLAQDAALALATDVLVGFQPAILTEAQEAEKLTQLAGVLLSRG